MSFYFFLIFLKFFLKYTSGTKNKNKNRGYGLEIPFLETTQHPDSEDLHVFKRWAAASPIDAYGWQIGCPSPFHSQLSSSPHRLSVSCLFSSYLGSGFLFFLVQFGGKRYLWPMSVKT